MEMEKIERKSRNSELPFHQTKQKTEKYVKFIDLIYFKINNNRISFVAPLLLLLCPTIAYQNPFPNYSERTIAAFCMQSVEKYR